MAIPVGPNRLRMLFKSPVRQPANPNLFLLLPHHVDRDLRRLKVAQVGAVVDPRVGRPFEGVERVGVDGKGVRRRSRSCKKCVSFTIRIAVQGDPSGRVGVLS